MATPVPTLDPNAVNTFIVQTANAASTRTASVPTLTATATLRNTSTPESTYTLVGTFSLPSPIPASKVQYFRVKHDNQLAIYNYKSRTADPSWPVESWGLQTTEVVPLSVGLKIGLGTHRTTMTGIWETYINKLNDYNEKRLFYVKADDTALFDGHGFPQMESLTMGGNIITLDEIRDGWGRVHTFDYNNPGAIEGINYKTNPDLVHKFVVIGWNRQNKISYLTNPPPGDLYWPLVSSRAVWIPLEFLEAFPTLPMVVTANTTQAVRKGPSIDSPPTSLTIAQEGSASVVEYYPSASDVWGRLASGGWIALLLHEKGIPHYLTSWEMNTRPPISPYE